MSAAIDRTLKEIGVVFATNNKTQYENFTLNCADLERLPLRQGCQQAAPDVRRCDEN